MWSSQVSTKVCRSYVCKNMVQMYIGGKKGQVVYSTATGTSIAMKLILGPGFSQYDILSAPDSSLLMNSIRVWYGSAAIFNH